MIKGVDLPASMPPSRQWLAAVSNASIRRDGVQESLLPLLDEVTAALNTPMQRVVWRGVEVWRDPEGNAAAPRGVYLHGDVGRGKSMLMQMVFEGVAIPEKRRVHFHPFMEELHQRIHHARPPHKVDLMLFVASVLSGEARLLCFDEFFITNIADGMLLGRLLESLFLCGVTVCATSNWGPDHLFQDGINRGNVLPFIALLKKKLHVLPLASGVDWRRQTAARQGRSAATPEELFTRLTRENPAPGAVTLRHTPVATLGMARGVWWIGFAELCSRMLGRAEYIHLCTRARTLVISGVPRLSCDGADTAMRFVVLVDLLYENRIPLHVFGVTDLEATCAEGPAAFAWRRLVSRVHELSRLTTTLETAGP